MNIISYTDLQVGNIVHFHGARFEIVLFFKLKLGA